MRPDSPKVWLPKSPEFLKDAVAGRVSVVVVDLFEAVEVENRDDAHGSIGLLIRSC